ncbi:MAG: hypothetical protein U0736_09455 [Gemmataceae bacterium]
MSVRWAIAIVAICTLLLAAIGGLIGYGIGTFHPDYYRQSLPDGWKPDFDPVSEGIGRGLGQGAAWGVAIGLAVTLGWWREAHRRRAEQTAIFESIQRTAWYHSVGCLVLVGTAVLAYLFGLCSGVILGELRVSFSMHHQQYLEEHAAVAPLLASDPAYAKVKIHEYTGGGLYLTGEVPTEADRDRLQAAIARAIGERRTREIYSTGKPDVAPKR